MVFYRTYSPLYPKIVHFKLLNIKEKDYFSNNTYDFGEDDGSW